jgi:hypothetical protein
MVCRVWLFLMYIIARAGNLQHKHNFLFLKVPSSYFLDNMSHLYCIYRRLSVVSPPGGKKPIWGKIANCSRMGKSVNVVLTVSSPLLCWSCYMPVRRLVDRLPTVYIDDDLTSTVYSFSFSQRSLPIYNRPHYGRGNYGILFKICDHVIAGLHVMARLPK